MFSTIKMEAAVSPFIPVPEGRGFPAEIAVNIVHPVKTVITGMTRDGTFLIERGEVKGPVRNLRFTQSVVEALARTEGLTRETTLEKGWYGGSRVPAILVRGFNFTS